MVYSEDTEIAPRYGRYSSTWKHHTVGLWGGYVVFTDLKGHRSQQTTFVEVAGKREEGGVSKGVYEFLQVSAHYAVLGTLHPVWQAV